MFAKWLLLLALLLTACSGLLYVGQYAWPLPSADGVTSDATRDEKFPLGSADQDVGSIVADLSIQGVTLRFHNPQATPVRIIGTSTGCYPGCCFRADVSEAVTIPPGGERTFPAEVKVSEPGPFDIPVTLFLDHKGLQSQTVRLRGQGIKP
jgi:hypothetical protein